MSSSGMRLRTSRLLFSYFIHAFSSLSEAIDSLSSSRLSGSLKISLMFVIRFLSPVRKPVRLFFAAFSDRGSIVLCCCTSSCSLVLDASSIGERLRELVAIEEFLEAIRVLPSERALASFSCLIVRDSIKYSRFLFKWKLTSYKSN